MEKPVLKAYVINVANDDFLISFNRETAVAAMEDIAGTTAGRITVEAVRGGFTPADIVRIAVGDVVPAPDYALTWKHKAIAEIDHIQ